MDLTLSPQPWGAWGWLQGEHPELEMKLQLNQLGKSQGKKHPKHASVFAAPISLPDIKNSPCKCVVLSF